MIEYIYFVKCPNCGDEHFNFFDEAKEFALSCLSKKPIITQIEVSRNDFGECTDSCDLGTVWSWEDMMKDTDEEPVASVFTKDDLRDDRLADDFNDDLTEDITTKVAFNNNEDRAEFFKLCSEIGITNSKDLNRFINDEDVTGSDLLDKLRDYRAELGDDFKIKESSKPVPEGMTIEELVEAMEENEDQVECTWCEDLFDKDQCRYEINLGWLCSRCQAAIMSRGETLTFRENNYWDFLDEDIDDARSLADLVKDSISHLTNDLGKDPLADDFADDVIADIENNYDIEVPEEPVKYRDWASAVACEVSRQLNNPKSTSMLEELEEAADYRVRLDTCPECGAENAFDKETGICIECGFNL